MSHAERLRHWQSVLAEYASSGLTMKEWCKRTGFRADQLRYWLNKCERTYESQSWACVGVVDDELASNRAALPAIPSKSSLAITGDPGITLRVGSACIDIRPGFDPHLLSEVLAVVASTC